MQVHMHILPTVVTHYDLTGVLSLSPNPGPPPYPVGIYDQRVFAPTVVGPPPQLYRIQRDRHSQLQHV